MEGSHGFVGAEAAQAPGAPRFRSASRAADSSAKRACAFKIDLTALWLCCGALYRPGSARRDCGMSSGGGPPRGWTPPAGPSMTRPRTARAPHGPTAVPRGGGVVWRAACERERHDARDELWAGPWLSAEVSCLLRALAARAGLRPERVLARLGRPCPRRRRRHGERRTLRPVVSAHWLLPSGGDAGQAVRGTAQLGMRRPPRCLHLGLAPLLTRCPRI